jgi:hypothetical protein
MMKQAVDFQNFANVPKEVSDMIGQKRKRKHYERDTNPANFHPK